MMSNLERLVYMANQIARNFDAMGEEAAGAATADHMIAYWDPHMRDQIAAYERAHPETLTPIARTAAKMISSGLGVAAQTRVTMSNAIKQDDRSDAG
jgi:formate dehydrogenase subunit delta